MTYNSTDCNQQSHHENGTHAHLSPPGNVQFQKVMQRQHKHQHIVSDVDRSEGIELSLSIDTSPLVQSIPVSPGIRHGSALENQTQAVCEKSDDLHPDEGPDGPSKPHSHRSLAPDPEVELEDTDSGDHDQCRV